MWPPVPLALLRDSELPTPLAREPDLDRAVHLSGGTIATDGGPMTTVAWQRIRAWREQWLALPTPGLPALIDADQHLYQGGSALDELARLAATTYGRPTSGTELVGASAGTV